MILSLHVMPQGQTANKRFLVKFTNLLVSISVGLRPGLGLGELLMLWWTVVTDYLNMFVAFATVSLRFEEQGVVLSGTVLR